MSYLGICEEKLNCCEEAEYAKDYEQRPFDVDKRGWDEKTDRKVE